MGQMGRGGIEDRTQGQMGSLLRCWGAKEEQVQSWEIHEAGPEQANDSAVPTGQAASCCDVLLHVLGRADAPWFSTGLCRWPQATPNTELQWEVFHPHASHIGGLGSLVPVSMFVKWLSDTVQVFEV